MSSIQTAFLLWEIPLPTMLKNSLYIWNQSVPKCRRRWTVLNAVSDGFGFFPKRIFYLCLTVACINWIINEVWCEVNSMILGESALTTHPLGFITGHKKNDTDINSIIFINDLKYFHLDFFVSRLVSTWALKLQMNTFTLSRSRTWKFRKWATGKNSRMRDVIFGSFFFTGWMCELNRISCLNLDIRWAK